MEVQVQVLQKVLISIALISIVGLLFSLYRALVANPNKLRSALRKQGISGPPPTLLVGNLLDIKKARTAKSPPLSSAPTHHNCANALFPFLVHWQKEYGDIFMFSIRNNLILHVTQHEMVKEITTCTSVDLVGKPSFQESGALLGRGIITSNGIDWANQRKIIAPEFHLDKVKGMIKLIQESAMILIDSWNNIIEAKGGIADIKIDQHMRSFSGDVISRACFGSSYSSGEEIFSKLRALQESASKRSFSFGIPGMSYLPTKSNRDMWALERDIKALILKIVKERNESGSKEDLLQMVLRGAINSGLSPDSVDRFIIDNCKNIYFAGYETTATSATWCLMLLAANPEWQDRVRSEVLDICKGQIPDGNMIKKMKLLSMVINESLRLYPPVPVTPRETFKDMKLGNICIPKGTIIWIFMLTLHTDPDVWGEDSYQFNPERFANGITGACKVPHLYMPFGVGPRVCLGQNLALLELKILISLILSNFNFTLSPSYLHSPTSCLVVQPEHGVTLNVKKQ